MNKKINIIIPTYNDERNIKNAIESVLNQSFKDFEIIVIDDGSTDKTREILESYINDKKIVYVFQKNSGQSIARYNGLLISKGEYIAFIDSDDEWIDKHKLKKQVGFLDNNLDYVLVGTCGIIVNESNIKLMDYEVPGSDVSIRRSIFLKNPFIQSSVIIRKDILNKIGQPLIKGCSKAEDYYLWLRVGLNGKFLNLREPMVAYMIREGNISSSNKKEILKNNISFIKEFRNDYPNYIKGLIFAYVKYFIFSTIKLIRNKKIKNIIIRFIYKKYRKVNLN